MQSSGLVAFPTPRYYCLSCWHRVQYHYGSQRVTADERIYHRDGPPRLVQVMPHTPQPPQALLAEEHQALLAAERDCLQVCLKMHAH